MDRIINNSNNNERFTNLRFVFPESGDSRIERVCNTLHNQIQICKYENYLGKITDYIEVAKKIEFAKNWPAEALEKYLEHPLHLSMMMLNLGDTDHLIAGIKIHQEDIIRSAVRIIGLQNRYKWVFSSSLLISAAGDQKYTFADCSIVAEPTPEQLTVIAGEAAKIHEKLTDEPPVVAFISFSTHGSISHYRVDKVKKAHVLFEKKFPHIPAIGEVQIEVALSPDSIGIGNGFSHSSLQPNVFIFPNLDAGSVGYQITKQLAGFQTAGSILHGLNKSVTLLSKKSNFEEILNAIYFAVKLKGKNANLQLQMQ